MAEERENKKPYTRGGLKRLARAVEFAALLVSLLCILPAVCPAAQTKRSNPIQTKAASLSDLSLPLWGGGEVPLNLSSHNIFPTGNIKLHHFDQVPCGNCHQRLSGSIQ